MSKHTPNSTVDANIWYYVNESGIIFDQQQTLTFSEKNDLIQAAKLWKLFDNQWGKSYKTCEALKLGTRIGKN